MDAIRHQPQKTIKKTLREMNIVEKTIEIARDRGFTTEELLSHDVAPSPTLFNDDGSMTKPDKSQLVKELEMWLKPEDYKYEHQQNSSFIIDVMSTVRKIRTAGLSKFQDLLLAFMAFSNVFHQFGRCDYVFDMYSDDPSVKDSERMRRAERVPIELSFIEPDTPLPKEMETFWPSNMNKLHLEKLAYSHLCLNTPTTHQYPTIVGQLGDWPCIMVHQGQENVLPQLQTAFQSTFLEADLRIPAHIVKALDADHKVCVVLCNDTDVIVALLYQIPVFLQHGLSELWVRAGVGDTTRYIPLHTLFQCLGHQLCGILPAVHSLTGCDVTSRVGTKKAALKAEPEKFLKYFGSSPALTASAIQKAEHYLVKVLKRGSDATNFVDL